MTTEEIILKIKADNSDALRNILELKKAIDALKESNAKLQTENKILIKSMETLNKEGKTNTDEFKKQQRQLEINTTTIAANSEAIKNSSNEINENSRQIQNNIKVFQQNGDSIEALQNRIASMKQAYYSLSKAERENVEIGGKQQKEIKVLNDELSEAEKSLTGVQSKVGNYSRLLLEATGANQGFIGQLGKMAIAAKENATSFGTQFTKSLKSAGNALKALMSVPIVLVLAGIVIVLQAVINAIKGNEEQTRKLKKVFAPLQAILDIIKGLFSALAEVLVKVMEWLGKVTGGITSFMEKIPFIGKLIQQVNEASKEAIKIEEDKQKLQDEMRQNTIDQAKTEKEVAELRAKYADKEKYTTKERLQFLEESIKKEEEQAKKNLDLKREELRLAQLTADKSEESKEKLIKLEAELINEEKNYNDKILSLANEKKASYKEVADEEKKSIEERKKKQEEYVKIVESGQKQIRDLTIDLMQEGLEKEKALRQKRYEEELKGIEGTEKQKTEIRKLLNAQYNSDMIAIEKKYSKEELDRAIAKKTSELEIMLELARDNAQKQFEIKLQQLEMEKMVALREAEETGISVELIEQQFAKKKSDLEVETAEQRRVEQATALEEYMTGLTEKYSKEFELLTNHEKAKAELQLQIEQDKLNALLNMTEDQKNAMFENEEAYQEAVRQQIKQTEQQEKAARVAALQDAQAKMDSLNQIAGSITDIFNQIAGDNEKMQAFLKAVALFQIGIDMAKAIAGAVSGAMTQPFPANIAAVISGIAAVTAGIIQAKNTLAKQKEAEIPKFSTGGLVSGEGNGTSDSIPAMLSDGESVINANSTAAFAPLLSAINQVGGGLPIQLQGSVLQNDSRDFVTASFVAALQAMPNPIVSVQEINAVNARVLVNETLRNR